MGKKRDWNVKEEERKRMEIEEEVLQRVEKENNQNDGEEKFGETKENEDEK